MTVFRRLISLWLLYQLSACTPLSVPPDSSPLSTHQSKPSSEYEQQIISDAETAANENRWAAAFKLYQQALNSFPDSLILQQANNALHQRQTAELAKLEQERLIARGEWLLKDLAISQLTGNEAPESWFAAHTHPATKKHQEATNLAEQLAKLGQQALAQNNLDLAAQALPLAWKLAPTTNHEALQNQLRLALKPPGQRSATTLSSHAPSAPLPPLTPLTMQQPEAAPPAASEKPATPVPTELPYDQKNNKRLLTDFKRSLKNGHFTEARQLLEKLQKQGIDKTTITNLQQQLNDNVAGQVKSLMADGVNDYSQQRYEAALKAWQRAQTLEPDNTQLAAHIERVNKVLEKLQGLRDKQLRTSEKLKNPK